MNRSILHSKSLASLASLSSATLERKLSLNYISEYKNDFVGSTLTTPATESFDRSTPRISSFPTTSLASGPVSTLLAVFYKPFRELIYLCRAFTVALQRPTWQQVVAGAVTKGPVTFLGLTAWCALFLPNHWPAFVCIAVLCTSQNAFHGIFVATWLNLQSILERERGIGYQLCFNLAYIQISAALFRFVTWTAIDGTVPPWSLSYWRDMSVMTLVGTFFGSLGYNGLNELYRKDYLTDNFRAYLQHFRDIFITVNGFFFGAGLILAYWSIFVLQQFFDTVLYYVGKSLLPKPGSAADVDGEHITSMREALSSTVAPFVSMYQAIVGTCSDNSAYAQSGVHTSPEQTYGTVTDVTQV